MKSLQYIAPQYRQPFKMITDSDDIRLFLHDILVDDAGDEWILLHCQGDSVLEPVEYTGDYYLKLLSTFDQNLLTCIRTDFAQTMTLK